MGDPGMAFGRRLAAGALALAVLAWGAAANAAGRCTLASPGATQVVTVGATGRSIQLHLPAGFDPAHPAPLLVLLHGSSGDGGGMLAGSKLEPTADRNGFVVAAPTGAVALKHGFAWNIPGVPTTEGPTPAGTPSDVAYIAAVIDWLEAEGCADPARVYVTGASGGGRMTSWLGCVMADRFAAIAPVIGLRAGNPSPKDPERPDPATCRPSRPLPLIAFAGDKDATNPIQGGGAPYWQYSMHAAEQRWAQLNRCTGAPQTTWITPGVYEERYATCAANAEVVARITVGAGHTWAVDNEAMWAFLSKYRR